MVLWPASVMDGTADFGSAGWGSIPDEDTDITTLEPDGTATGCNPVQVGSAAATAFIASHARTTATPDRYKVSSYPGTHPIDIEFPKCDLLGRVMACHCKQMSYCGDGVE